MKIKRLLSIFSIIFITLTGSFAQDKRTLETKVADLLAQMPANDIKYSEKLMDDMIALGEEGFVLICNQIIPAGTGDDTRARFAVESLSRYLSGRTTSTEKGNWEKVCLSFATGQSDKGVKDFFIKQLQLIGSDVSINALRKMLNDKEMCEPAIAAILSIGGKPAETAFAESLSRKDPTCVPALMNALAGMKSSLAVNEFIRYASDANSDIRASALNALACSGSPLALEVLLKAAQDAKFRWEPSDASSSLLKYAKYAGDKGDLKTMDKICKLVIAKANDKLSMQNKIKALMIYSEFHGINAMRELIRAARNPDKSYRNAAFRVSLAIPGREIADRWIEYFPKAIGESKPEIIAMLGEKGEKAAFQLISSSLSDPDKLVRTEAAQALVKISGKESVPILIEYMRKFSDSEDQEAAKTSLMTVSGNKEIELLKPVLKDGSSSAKKSAIELIAWNKGKEYFDEIVAFTESTDNQIRSAAFKALKDLAEPENQSTLIDLILRTENGNFISDIQAALAAATANITDNEARSSQILTVIKKGVGKEKLIPVLSTTGGRDALRTVLDEFEKGTPEMRDICFKAIYEWSDHTASSALYEICASRNKTFEEPAFNGYVDQINTAGITDEQKLLAYKKIMPFALSNDRKTRILQNVAKIKTYQALFFVAGYLDDPAVSASSANAVMMIALPSTNSKVGMYGTMVREILLKAASLVEGPEADYDRERINKYLASMPADEGFKPLFNGKDLTGWQGLVENPLARAKMKRTDLERKQAEANVMIPASWSVKDGCIWFNGKGSNLCTIKEYGDFEMLVDWKISKGGDSGIYLRGTPQVQIWDTSRKEEGAQVGSGGLYNNRKNPSKPLVVADNPVGEWNTFRIIMTGERVSVWLNGILVVDNVIMENYWDPNLPIFAKGQIELQAHGTDLAFRDLYIREISDKDYNLTPEEKAEGFVSLFNGKNLDGWIGNKQSYVAEDGMIVIKPENGSGGNLYTEKEYSDFIFRFEFQLTPAANNGLGIRAPLEGDAAYTGMELQILDNTAEVYSKLQPYQYHGSVYGVIPARRDFLKPVGEWNYQEVVAKGTRITVILNGTVIVDGDISGPRDNGTMDHNDHPGLKNKSGHIGFLGHGSVVRFRNIRIKELTQ